MDSGGVDRISGLQDDLILRILSFVGLKDAIGTSVLSPRWQYVWTSIPHLSLSTEDFSTMDKFSDFVTHLLSRRNNQAQLSSVRLYLCAKDGGPDAAQQIINYAFSLCVQHVNLTCLFGNLACLCEKDIEFSLSLPNSQTLKHLTFCRPYGYDLITLTSTCELSSLTTLHIEGIMLYDGIFSMFPNLENLTLIYCIVMGSHVLSISHHRLSNLTLHVADLVTFTINVVTPRLKSLSVTAFARDYLISAPELASLLFRGNYPLSFSTDGFHSLEKAQLSLRGLRPSHSHAPNIIGLLQKLHNVKLLSLSTEIIQLLNASVELISHQPSLFTHLKSLKVLPKVACAWRHEHAKLIICAELKNYLLNGSPKATLTEAREHCCDRAAGVYL